MWYPQDEPTIHWWKVGPGDVREVVSEEGLDQGCPLASPAFGVSTCRPAARALEAILREDPTASLLQFADDTHVHTEPANLSRAHRAISDDLAKAGLSPNIAKTEVWTPKADTDLGDWERSRVPSLRCLGAFLEDDGIAWSGPGLGGETSEELERAAAKLEAYADRLCELQEAGLTMQLSQALLRYASVGGPQHVLMCKAVSRDQAEAYDARVRICWEKVVAITFTDSAWSRATLPLKMGGIAPGTVADRASAAFITATTRTLPEVLRRTGLGSVSAVRLAAPSLDNRIIGAAADLVDRGVEGNRIPLTEESPHVAPRQKDLVDRVHKERYRDLLGVLDDSGRGQLRSASGPGAASFLTLPTQQNHYVEDTLFRVAVVRRLGGRILPKDDRHAPHCALYGGRGRCNEPLDPGGIHANQCKMGGFVVRRHDRIVRWLAEWLADRVETEVLVEQATPVDGEPKGRLDVTLESNGRRLWIDVAVVTVMTFSDTDRLRRANVDGAAARREESRKKAAYKALATPFVVEALGRPGDTARSVLGRFAADQGRGVSADVSAAWQTLSAIVQSDTSALELRACGYVPSDWTGAGYSF